jgi:DNA-binding beta-propeller fold protein YncE
MPVPSSAPRSLPTDSVAMLLLGVALALLVVAATAPWSRDTAGSEGMPTTLVAADLRGRALIVTSPSGQRTIPLPGGPHELALLPDGRVAVSLEQQGAIALVTLEDGNVDVLPTGGLPHGLAVWDSELLVTDRGIGAVRRFALDDWRELPPIEAPSTPHALVLTEAGSPLLANAASEVLTLPGGASIPQPSLVETIALSPDGRLIAVAGAADGRVLIVDRSGRTVLDLTVGGRPVRVAFAPDGSLLAVSLSAAHEVALIPVDDLAGAGDSLDVRRVAVPGVPDGLAFIDDGRRLVVSNLVSGGTSIIELASGHVAPGPGGGVSTGALLVPGQR